MINLNKYMGGYSAIFDNLKKVPFDGLKNIKNCADQTLANLTSTVESKYDVLKANITSLKSSLCLSSTNQAYLKQTLKIATLALAGFGAYYTYKVCAQESDYQPIGSDLIASNANALIKFPEQIFNFTKNNDIGFCDAPILPYRANVDKALDATNSGQEVMTKLALTFGLGYIAVVSSMIFKTLNGKSKQTNQLDLLKKTKNFTNDASHNYNKALQQAHKSISKASELLRQGISIRERTPLETEIDFYASHISLMALQGNTDEFLKSTKKLENLIDLSAKSNDSSSHMEDLMPNNPIIEEEPACELIEEEPACELIEEEPDHTIHTAISE